MDDMQKMLKEDPLITKKFNPDEDCLSSYTQHSTSTTSFDSAFSQSGIKKYKRPTKVDYLLRFGEEHADLWENYTNWKKAFRKEETGSCRELYSQEKIYFDFVKQYYEGIPALRSKPHFFTVPPQSWKKGSSNSSLPKTSLT
jgi:hypothetical protein